MKKLIILCLIFASLIGRAQISPTLQCRVANLTTAFGQNLPVGTEVFVISDSTKWTARAYVASSATMTTALSSFFPSTIRVKGTLPVTTSGVNGKIQIGVNPVTTLQAGLMSAADKVLLNSLVSFPGFGITHTTAAYGDHLHAGVYEVPLTFSAGLSRVGNTVTNTLTGFPGFGISHALAAYGDHLHAGIYQPVLSGIGLVRISGTDITYDNTAYWYSGSHPATTTAYGLPAYPTTLPASDVYAWAKASVKPSYTYSEVGAQVAGSYQATLASGTNIKTINGSSILGSGNLTVSGMIYPNSGIGVSNGSAWSGSVQYGTANAGYYLVQRDASGYVSLTGTFCSSDSTLKKTIKSLSKIDLNNASKIDFRKFAFKTDTKNRLHFGVIAQEVEKLIPEVVFTNKAGKKEVNYTELLILLVAQQKDAIERLEKRIKALENEN